MLNISLARVHCREKGTRRCREFWDVLEGYALSTGISRLLATVFWCMKKCPRGWKIYHSVGANGSKTLGGKAPKRPQREAARAILAKCWATLGPEANKLQWEHFLKDTPTHYLSSAQGQVTLCRVSLWVCWLPLSQRGRTLTCEKLLPFWILKMTLFLVFGLMLSFAPVMEEASCYLQTTERR